MIANVSAHRRANAFAQALEAERAPAAERTPRDEAADQGADTPPPDRPPTDRTSQGRVPEPTPPRRAPGERDPAGPPGPGKPPSPPTGDPEQQRMSALATRLGQLPGPQLDASVKAVQRAQLVAAAEALGSEVTAAVPEQRSRRGKGAHRATGLRGLRPRSRLTKGLAAGGLTFGVAAGAFSGVAAASSNALPGDSLYGLKRGMEDFRLGLADGDSDRGELYLGQASNRLSEARRLMERGRGGHLDHEAVGEVRRALSAVQHDASEGHRLLFAAYRRDGSLAPIQTLSSFSRSHRDSWSALRDRLPVQLDDVGARVNSVFDAIDDEVRPLAPLFPENNGKNGHPRDPAAGGTEAPSDSGRPRPSASGSDSPDASPGSRKPSPSDSGHGGGLLDGPGGLLDPPRFPEGPSPSGKGSGERPPDVTLPPLFPGLLPGLGIEEEDAP